MAPAPTSTSSAVRACGRAAAAPAERRAGPSSRPGAAIAAEDRGAHGLRVTARLRLDAVGVHRHREPSEGAVLDGQSPDAGEEVDVEDPELGLGQLGDVDIRQALLEEKEAGLDEVPALVVDGEVGGRIGVALGIGSEEPQGDAAAEVQQADLEGGAEVLVARQLVAGGEVVGAVEEEVVAGEARGESPPPSAQARTSA